MTDEAIFVQRNTTAFVSDHESKQNFQTSARTLLSTRDALDEGVAVLVPIQTLNKKANNFTNGLAGLSTQRYSKTTRTPHSEGEKDHLLKRRIGLHD